MVSQNIGNGTGMLYATDIAATKIISCTRNDKEGVRNMRTLGAGSAPIAAKRSAVATVTFTAVGGAGNITAITITGVNQIPSNVAATVGDPTQTATDVAAAINGYTPGSGVDFTANAIDDVLYIYSTPSTGQATNGAVVTVSVSNVAITTTKTDFAGGSSETGNTDSSVGLRFYLDPKGNAPRTSFASAEEITKYIVVRGLQTGIVTKTLSVDTGRLTSIDRSCAITQIFTDTESSAATDDLDFIETVDFVEGDVIRLTQYVSGRVVTVTDANTSSGNIYLTNQSPFNCEDNKSIELRLQYDSTLGLIWIENGRSVSQGYAELTWSAMKALVAAGSVSIGQTYYINNAPEGGVIVQGAAADAITTLGQLIAYVPDYQNVSGDFGGVWTAKLANVVVGKLYSYNGLMYEATTVNTGTDPSSDANFTLIATSDPRYIKEIDTVQYNLASNSLVKREDARGNVVFGTSAIQLFKWGCDTCYGNIVTEGSFAVCNVTGNFTSNVLVNSTTNVSTLTNSFVGNSISNVTLSVSLSGDISFNYNNFQGDASYPSIVVISESAASTTITISNNKISTQSGLALVCSTSESFLSNTISAVSVSFVMNGYIAAFNEINTNTAFSFSLQATMTTNVINSAGSTYHYVVDLDTAMSGTTLSLPSAARPAGVLLLASAAGGKNIVKIASGGSIVGYQTFPVTLVCDIGDTNDVTPTAVGAAVTGNIVSDAGGAVSLVGRANGTDFYQIQLDGNVWKLLNSKVYV